METIVMLSNRHVHLSEENAKKLFGEAGITFSKYLKGNSGPWASNEYVTLRGSKSEITKVRVLGPCRNYNQAELLKTDCFKLGVDAPVRSSGELDGAAELEIIGPNGSVVENCGIIALRHIHVCEEIRKENGIEEGQFVKVRATGVRGLTFENVKIVDGKGNFLMHVDNEEGNAAGIKSGDMLEIIV